MASTGLKGEAARVLFEQAGLRGRVSRQSACPYEKILWFEGTKDLQMIPKSRCAKLVTSNPRRCEAVVVTKGASTTY